MLHDSLRYHNFNPSFACFLPSGFQNVGVAGSGLNVNSCLVSGDFHDYH